MKRPSYYNKEGYPDPTNYYAMLHIDETEMEHKKSLHAFRPIVYICSPLRGDVTENVKNARRYSRFAVRKGYLPIAPHLLFPQFMNDANMDEREIAICMGMTLMTKCVELWVFGGYISEGMKREIKKARWRGIPIRYFTKDLQEEER